MLKTDDIFPIGIGTWGVGGFAERNPSNDDEKQIKALSYMLDKGMNFVETCYWYSEGKATELFVEALKGAKKKREELFLVASIYSYKNPKIINAEKEFEKLLKMFDTVYFDSVQVTLKSLAQWGERKTIKTLSKYLDKKLTRYLSVTNFNLENLKRFKKEFGDKLFSHELVYNFEIRENEDMEITSFAEENEIKNVVFQPLRRNRTAKRNWSLLVELSKKYKKTQNQIILNWLISKGFLPITKSETIEHIDEHLSSINFQMEKDDLERLNSFRPEGWKTLKIDWYQSGKGVGVFMLPNVFDEVYEN